MAKYDDTSTLSNSEEAFISQINQEEDITTAEEARREAGKPANLLHLRPSTQAQPGPKDGARSSSSAAASAPDAERQGTGLGSAQMSQMSEASGVCRVLVAPSL